MATTKEKINFEDLGLTKHMINGLRDIGIREPTEVQAACMEKILSGRHCIANSPTGTGKTLAFAVPMIQKWSEDPFGVFGLVLTPTRELGHQIKEQFELVGGTALKVSLIIGGVDMQTQSLELCERPHFVISTPGRLSDLLTNGGPMIRRLFKNLRFLVYDEADRLLDGQFDEQLQQIMGTMPSGKQTLLFTATITSNVQTVCGVLHPEKVSLNLNSSPLTQDVDLQPFFYDYTELHRDDLTINKDKLTQRYVICPPDYKDGYLMEILRAIRESQFPATIRSMIIFAGTCKECICVSILLTQLGFPNVALHSQMSQKERGSSLTKFKSSLVPALVATDVVSRGLDIQSVDLVINFVVPWGNDYVHRVGRAGRGKEKGYAVTIITPRDIPFFKMIERYIGEEIEEMQIDESKVLKNLLEVTTMRKSIELSVSEDGTFEEQKKRNELKRKLIDGDTSSPSNLQKRLKSLKAYK